MPTERECHSSAGDVEGSGVRDGELPVEEESFYNTQGGTLTTAQEMIVLAQSMTATAKRMTALAKRARVIELQHKKLSIQVQHSKSGSQGHHAGAVGTLGIPAPGDAAEGAQDGSSKGLDQVLQDIDRSIATRPAASSSSMTEPAPKKRRRRVARHVSSCGLTSDAEV